MELKIYPLLCAESQKAMLKTKQKHGSYWREKYYYEPNWKLLTRLSVKLQMSKSELRTRILEEKNCLLSNQNPNGS